MNKNLIISSLLVLLLVASLYYRPAWAQEHNEDPVYAGQLAAVANLERIRAQVQLAQKSLDHGDRESAFAHAFISHAAIFPSVKDNLESLDGQSATKLESMLADLAFMIKDGSLSADQARQQAAEIQATMDDLAAKTGIASDKTTISQVTVLLLRDSLQSYRLYSSGSQKVDYENAVGLADLAHEKYLSVAGSIEASRKAEVDSFFSDITSSLALKSSPDSLSRLVSAVEHDLAENLSQGEGGSGGYSQYFSTIRALYSQLISQVKAGDYTAAEQSGISAYLDNFEYLEAPLEKHDAGLKNSMEIAMRVDLREKIKARQSPSSIESFVNVILADLDKAEGMLKDDPGYTATNTTTAASHNSFADIEGLSQGFGAYSGPKKERGDAADQAKEQVRLNIDQIRTKLDETLHIYQTGDTQGAIQASRSAYLDSYENIELPLRPINPDFTLEMEIKFAELRNLMQEGAPYDQVAGKVVEIRRGLDESERLVTGTGSFAPAIAFSTSFSIVFREGLESALIIGAILTYLEASRNERFKRHVYYGIVLAFAGTAATWFAAQYLIEISGVSKSMIEAIAGVSAVGVLFWVSFWILNKVETKKWIEFVKAKVWKATTTGSVMVFVMLSFFTIYREGFETVLFYQAMLSFAKYMEWYVAAGLVLGLGIIAGVTFVVRRFGKKLPLRVLFALTMGIGAYMSVAFMGNAVREFQEVGYIPTTHVATIPRLDINTAAMTGIHPTLETAVAQLVLTAVYLAGSAYVLIIQPKRQKAVASARKSRADLEGAGKANVDIEDH
jgi:high-affinity iron transporter